MILLLGIDAQENTKRATN